MKPPKQDDRDRRQRQGEQHTHEAEKVAKDEKGEDDHHRMKAHSLPNEFRGQPPTFDCLA